jgi:hypothetical protein
LLGPGRAAPRLWHPVGARVGRPPGDISLFCYPRKRNDVFKKTRICGLCCRITVVSNFENVVIVNQRKDIILCIFGPLAGMESGKMNWPCIHLAIMHMVDFLWRREAKVGNEVTFDKYSQLRKHVQGTVIETHIPFLRQVHEGQLSANASTFQLTSELANIHENNILTAEDAARDRGEIQQKHSPEQLVRLKLNELMQEWSPNVWFEMYGVCLFCFILWCSGAASFYFCYLLMLFSFRNPFWFFVVIHFSPLGSRLLRVGLAAFVDGICFWVGCFRPVRKPRRPNRNRPKC